MGRAINMEKDVNNLKQQIEKLENTVRGMVSKLESLDEKSSKTIKVNLTEDVGAIDSEELGSTITNGATICKMEEENEEEKANDKGSGKSGKQSNNKSRKSSKKNV